ncbi:MAG TPA: beta-N-acetylhexosaminidase [Acidobacteriaceae bacterium]|nr:beta-N-acetylhexosaminidase [Acidobacteriaceae bacterium]
MKRATTLRHKIGSLLIIGVEGTSLSTLESAWLRSLQPSGLLCFRRNIESAAQIHSLFRQVSETLESSYFRCIDLEGGSVDRLRDMVGRTPSAAEVAATASLTLYHQHGAFIGRVLHALGFNVNLAPVLDLGLPPALQVMRTRIVSADPIQVIAYARAFLAGLARYGIAGCGKHFPGLGGGALDSHQATPTIDRTWNQLWKEDLLPYREMRAELPMVMVNHAAYPKVEDAALPASLSRFWVQDVLRTKLRYRGLIVSDDMEMGGVLNHTSPEAAAIEAIAAGTDLLEICQRADRILSTHEALLREAERSPAFLSCVVNASERVEKAKRRLVGKTALPNPISPSALEKLRAAQNNLHKRISRAVERGSR